HVLQFSQRISHHQRATARNLFAVDGNVHFVGRDEVRRDGEIVLPMFDPVLGIAPMPLGGVRDLSQRCRFIWLRSANSNVHAHRSLTLSWSDNRVVIRPLPLGEGRGEGLVPPSPSSLFPSKLRQRDS